MKKVKESHLKCRDIHVEMTPRMWLIKAFRFLFVLLLGLVGLGLGGLAVWGGKEALDHLVYRNPDYELRHIDLTPNEAINERDFIQLTGLDINANLYQLNIKELTRKLRTHPAIVAGEVKRQSPNTLVVKVSARQPRVWLACPEAGVPADRRPGCLLLSEDGVAYPCPALQAERAGGLPIVTLGLIADAVIRPGELVQHPQLENCLRLVDAARRQGDGGLEWIDSVRQEREWSLTLTTRRGVVATFGLDEHDRQLSYLNRSLGHAATKGYTIATINLIPRKNVPVTLAGEVIPKAIPVPEDESEAPSANHH